MFNEEEPDFHANGIGNRKLTREELEGFETFFKERAKNETPEQKRKTITIGWMIKMLNHKKSEIDEVIEVGFFLEGLLNDLNIKKGDFAKYVGLKPSNLSALISGKRRLNADLAMKFEAIFEISANMWLNVQTKNELVQIKTNSLEREYKLADFFEA